MLGNEIWIGLADVKPKEGNDSLGDSKGAYVNIIALASSSEEFYKLVEIELLRYGFVVLNIEDIELFYKRIESYSISDELRDIAREVEETEKVGVGSFHSYRQDETLN